MVCPLNLIQLMIITNVFLEATKITLYNLYEVHKGTTRTCEFVRNETGNIVTKLIWFYFFWLYIIEEVLKEVWISIRYIL